MPVVLVAGRAEPCDVSDVALANFARMDESSRVRICRAMKIYEDRQFDEEEKEGKNGGGRDVPGR